MNRSKLRDPTRSLESGCKKKCTRHRTKALHEALPDQDAPAGNHFHARRPIHVYATALDSLSSMINRAHSGVLDQMCSARVPVA